MASNPPHSDITQCSADELLAALGVLGVGRDTLGASMIHELQQRDMSLNKIADDSGMARTTVKRWAGKADPE
jgi:hypothetical protein